MFLLKGTVYLGVLTSWPRNHMAAWPCVAANKILVNFDHGSMAAEPRGRVAAKSNFQKLYGVIRSNIRVFRSNIRLFTVLNWMTD